jgi:hypothetical protein
MVKSVFSNPEPPSTLEREVIARQLVRNLEKIAKFQIEQLSGESWTHLKIHAPDKLVKIFKRVEDKKLRPIIKGNVVYVYIDSNVTPMDVRLLTGELIKNYKNINETKITYLRKKLGIAVFKLAKLIYPTKQDSSNG